MKIIKKTKLLTTEQQSNENAKMCYICEEKFENKYVKDKTYYKVRDHCHYKEVYRGTARSICNLKNRVSRKLPMTFQNGSKYDYHCIIKGLAEEL